MLILVPAVMQIVINVESESDIPRFLIDSAANPMAWVCSLLPSFLLTPKDFKVLIPCISSIYCAFNCAYSFQYNTITSDTAGINICGTITVTADIKRSRRPTVRSRRHIKDVINIVVKTTTAICGIY